jgi:ABC-type dipeptide/oligopeptide/nickel transport system permease component
MPLPKPVRRVLITLPVLWVVVSVVFLLIHIVPGDPIVQMLGEGATASDVSALRHAYTLELTLAALLIGMAISIPAGVFSALHRGRWQDRLLGVVSLGGLSFPNFALGPILILIFSIRLGWLPVSGAGTGRDFLLYLILPALTLGSGLAAVLTRMVRTCSPEPSLPKRYSAGPESVASPFPPSPTGTMLWCRDASSLSASPTSRSTCSPTSRTPWPTPECAPEPKVE